MLVATKRRPRRTATGIELPRVDARTVAACRFRELVDTFTSELGSNLTEADRISLAEVRRTAKASEVRPLYSAIAALLYLRLVDLLGPTKIVERKPAKVKLAPKPPRSITRIPEVEKNIAFGLELIALRATVQSNAASVAKSAPGLMSTASSPRNACA
jgi:hypothetical protein